jgi:hypothetical protein
VERGEFLPLSKTATCRGSPLNQIAATSGVPAVAAALGVLVSPLTKALTSQRTPNEAVTLDTGEQIAIMPGLGKISPIVCLIPRLAAIMLSTEI